MNEPMLNSILVILGSSLLMGCAEDEKVQTASPPTVRGNVESHEAVPPKTPPDQNQKTPPVQKQASISEDPQPEPWKPVALPNGIKFEMPGQPSQEGPVFSFVAEDIVYNVAFGFVPKIEGQDPKEALNQHQQRSISDDKTIESEEFVELEGASAAKQIMFSEGESRFVVKFFLMDNWVTQMMVTTDPEHLDSPDIKRFFDSVSIPK